MSVTIKTNAMKYKDSTGEYHGFNAIAQESTNQQLNDIADAGQIQINAVEQKGIDTLNSIPNNYQALQSKVNSLDNIIVNEQEARNELQIKTDNMIIVSDEEPQTEDTKVWINPDFEEMQVPTYAEYSELISEVDELKGDVTRLRSATAIENCGDIFKLIDFYRGKSFPTSGIEFNWNDDYSECTISGGATSNANYNLYSDGSALPNGIVPGETYEVILSGWPTDVQLRIVDYSGGVSGTVYYASNTSGSITIGENATGLICQIRVANGAVMGNNPGTVVKAPQLLTTKTNKQLEQMVSQGIDDLSSIAYLGRIIGEITDLNDVVLPGYYALTYSRDYDHCPVQKGTGIRRILEHCKLNNSGTLGYQILMVNYTSTGIVSLWNRNKADGNWGDWVEVTNSTLDGRLTALEELAKNDVLGDEFMASPATGVAAYTGTKLRVMSYNVAHYDNDTSTIIPDNYIRAFRMFIGDVNADVIGVQEDYTHLNNQAMRDLLYGKAYPIEVAKGSIDASAPLAGTMLRSKNPFISSGCVLLSTSRILVYATQEINEKIALFISAHPTPGSEPSNEQQRQVEYTALFQWVKGQVTLKDRNSSNNIQCPAWEWCIMTGDYNSVTSNDRSALKTLADANGFTMANGGWLGWMVTRPASGTMLDNIICSDNVIIENTKVYNSEFNYLYSDHVPVVSDLILTD